jgi:hypothetical protein
MNVQAKHIRCLWENTTFTFVHNGFKPLLAPVELEETYAMCLQFI